MKLTQEEWTLLSSRLDEGLDLPEDRRAAWVDSLADLNAPLKDALREMLTRPASADFLRTLPKLDVEPVSQEAGEIGPYRLIRELGRGGMGSVWLAERSDGVLKRHVALKLPHAGAGGAQFLERFHRERDILASLIHPNIATLYDAGLAAGGRPFIALEYVDGSSLTEWCDRGRRTVRERLTLFLDVLAGVQYAHAHLVLHRDLKPSNILVTQTGEVKLLDFGIAKLMTQGEARETELTEVGGRALTLDYASPEQISGRPMSTASDVYSLGVILFELLSGERPYPLKRDTKGTLEEAILTTDAKRPSQSIGDRAKAEARSTAPKKLAGILRGDLDTIVAKALRKEPAGRYATADALAQDLQRYLAGEPVLAQPESAAYRAGKFIRRHRLGVLASAGAGLALAIGLGVALWEARAAQREARTSLAVVKFLTDIFRANSSDQPDPAKARQTTARELLDIGAAKIDGEMADSPEARLSLLKTLSGLYSDLGLDDQSVVLGRKQVALAKQLHGSRSAEMADALVDLAGSMHSSGSVNQEEDVLREAGQVLDSRGDWSSLTRARLENKRSEFFYATDLSKAVACAHNAVRIYRAYPPSTEMVEALYEEGLLHSQRAENAEAISVFQEAISLSRKLEGDPNPALPRLYAIQGEVQEAAMQFAAAEESLRAALAAAHAINGDQHVDTVQTTMRLGMFLAGTARLSEGIATLRKARDLVLKLRGADDSFYTPQVLLEYGWAQVRNGQIEAGLASISQAVANRRKNRPGTRYLAIMLEDQAAALIEMGEYAEARVALDESLAILTKVHDTADWKNAYFRAKLLLATGKADEAAKLAGDAGPEKASLQYLRATLLEGEAALARKDAETAVRLGARLSGSIAGNVARPYLKEQEASAALLEGRGHLLAHRPEAALPRIERAAELRASALDSTSAALGDAYVALAECRATMGDRVHAAAVLQQARAIFAVHQQLGAQHLQPLRDVEALLRRAP